MAEDQNEILRSKHHGLLSIKPEMTVMSAEELKTAYTPGVAEIANEIAADESQKNRYTISGKLVAVVTDGSAVLGLGNIGPAAGLPIVEAKALLYRSFAQVDAIPLALKQVAVADFVKTLVNIQESFAGIHLEDIAAPKCFEIESALKRQLQIPVYHDDQEGSAIVVLAGLINAAKVVEKKLTDLKIVQVGIGAAGVATTNLLLSIGIKQITLIDRYGVITENDSRYNSYQRRLASQVNSTPGSTLNEVIQGADVFIGLSDRQVLTQNQVQLMNPAAIVFALANPIPEIAPAQAAAGGAAIIATGSSKYPNQVNNILVFPGLFQGLLASGLKTVSLKLEAQIAQALARMVSHPKATKIVPSVFDPGVVTTVANTVEEYAQARN